MTNNAATARTFFTSSGRMHLLVEVIEEIPNGYTSDPSKYVLVRARNACGRTYTGTATRGAGDLDAVNCDRCRFEVGALRAAAPVVEEIPPAEPVVADEPHAFSAKGSAKASACVSCERTWAASAHRRFRAAAAV